MNPLMKAYLHRVISQMLNEVSSPLWAGSALLSYMYKYLSPQASGSLPQWNITRHVCDKCGDQPAYKSHAFTQSCTQLTTSTHHSQACSSTAALMTFQMPPAIRPFDSNHWLCGSSPLAGSKSGNNYHPVNEGPELNSKPTRG